jgi:hypothetical protein
LIPDAVWHGFDSGNSQSKKLDLVRENLHRYGGRHAWLRFLEESRRELPRMLDVPILDVMERARKPLELDQPFWLTHRVVITAYAGGRSVIDPIVVVVIVHFDREDNPISDR